MADSLQKIDDILPVDGQHVKKEGAWADYAEGKALLERGETGLAVVSLHNALVGFEEKNDQKGIANALNQMGLACMHRKDYNGAYGHFSRAEDVVRVLEDPMSLLALSKQIVDVCTQRGDYDEALDRCIDILDLYRANNDPKGSVEIIEKMADIYIGTGQKGKAADAYRTVASIHRNFKHPSIAESYMAKAEALRQEQ